MKKFLTMGIVSLLALSMMAGCTSAAAVSDGPSSDKFDFEKDDAGFTPIYADYPYSEGVEEFYEFQHDYSKVPIDGAGNGIFISGKDVSLRRVVQISNRCRGRLGRRRRISRRERRGQMRCHTD